MAKAAVVAVLLVALAACAGPAVHTATYASFSEATAAGAVDRGWVPAWLPTDAYELRAAYAVDGSQRWGLFNFRPADAAALREALGSGEVSLAGVEIDIPRRIEWWPVLMRGTLDPESIQVTGIRAYRSSSGDFVVAVNWQQGRAYYWRQQG